MKNDRFSTFLAQVPKERRHFGEKVSQSGHQPISLDFPLPLILNRNAVYPQFQCSRRDFRLDDITRWFNRMCDALADALKPRPKMKATRGGKAHVPNDRAADHDYNQRQHAQQQRIDAILDKISKGGYDALSAEEKAMLFDASQRRKM